MHKIPPPVLILSQLDPVHATPSDFLKSHFNIILPSTPGSSKWFVSFRSPKLFAPLLSPIVPLPPPQLILLDLITRIMFGVYRSRSSSLCSLFRIPLTSSLLGPNILLSPLFSKYPQPTFFPQSERPSFTPIQNNRQNYSSLMLIFIILYNKVTDKRFYPECWQAFPEYHLFLISS